MPTTTHKLLRRTQLSIGLFLLAPAVALAQPTLVTDATIDNVYTLEQLSLADGPHVVRAVVRNTGRNTISSLGASLQIGGANSFSANTVINSLAPGASTIISFPAFSPSAAGSQSLLVLLDNDDDTSNNTFIATQEVTAATTSYITPGVGNSTSLGFGAGTTAAFMARFSTAGPRDLVAVRAFVTGASTVGKTLYAVAVDPATGALLGRTSDYVVQAADINTLHTFTFGGDVALTGGDFLAGMTMVGDNQNNYYPMGLQAERPTRPESFYSMVLPTGGLPYDIGTSNFGKLMLEVETAPPATCPNPRNISATVTPTSAILTFTGPPNGTSYLVKYGPVGFDPNTAGTTLTATASPFTINNLQPSTEYQVYLKTVCDPGSQSIRWAGPIAVSTPCTPPIITSFPYTQDFDVVASGQPLPCGISVIDSNNDANSWQARTTVATSTNPNLPIGRGNTGRAMVYYYNETNSTIGGDDWFFTPAFRLTGGQHYRLSFYYRAAGPAFREALEVKFGAAATPTAQTTVIYNNPAIVNAAYAAATSTTTPAVADIVPPATGVYYVGFHATSTPDQYYLAIDDLTISAVLSTASPALQRAISLYPNPSASGRFSLDIHGANAAQGLDIVATNTLGQRVYTGRAKDNFSNALDLSGLPSGLYTLKVWHGDEYSMQAISIAK